MGDGRIDTEFARRPDPFDQPIGSLPTGIASGLKAQRDKCPSVLLNAAPSIVLRGSCSKNRPCAPRAPMTRSDRVVGNIVDQNLSYA
jgi:hypothetical protein